MFFIAAPFGNYLKFKGALSVSGTWTARPRSGRFIQVLKTLRYTKYGWVNKLGLRNKGIDYGLKLLKRDPDDILSIAAIEPPDWNLLYQKIPKSQSVEVNLGCPNTPKNLWHGFDYFAHYALNRKWCIAKIPPTFQDKDIDYIVDSGFKQIHACNTIPTDKGGLSGRDIVPHTIRCIKYIKKVHPHVEVIAGGGIYSPEDVQKYKDYGADHFSLGTICFTPWKIKGVIKMSQYY